MPPPIGPQRLMPRPGCRGCEHRHAPLARVRQVRVPDRFGGRMLPSTARTYEDRSRLRSSPVELRSRWIHWSCRRRGALQLTPIDTPAVDSAWRRAARVRLLLRFDRSPGESARAREAQGDNPFDIRTPTDTL